MKALLYCPERNIYRLRDILSGREKTITPAEMDDAAQDSPWIAAAAAERLAEPNVEAIVAY